MQNLERYSFQFPGGEKISFHGAYVGGLRGFLGSLDLAVYRTERSWMLILAAGRVPQTFYEYGDPDEMARFLLGSVAQVVEELTGEKPAKLGDRELVEFLRDLSKP